MLRLWHRSFFVCLDLDRNIYTKNEFFPVRSVPSTRVFIGHPETKLSVFEAYKAKEVDKH